MVVTGTGLARGALAFFFGVLAGGLFGCNEKSASAPTSPRPPVEDDESDDDDGDEGDEGDGVDPTTFDLCTDGLKKTSLTGFSSYIEQLCDGSDKKLDALRASDAVYKGGTAKIFEDDVKQQTLETSVRLYSSTLVDAKVQDYWALLKLQLKKAKTYSENYDRDAAASISEEVVKPSSVKYRYTYTDEGGGADYIATTKFVELKAGQAYLTATKEDEMKATMKTLTGLIIINKVSSAKTEVFTMSDQTYEHQEGQSQSVKDSAIETARAEQVRMFKNAKSADKAPGLLGE